MKKLRENNIDEEYIIFDDSEFDDFEEIEEEAIEIDEEFEKQLSKELDDLLKEHPLQYEE